MLPNKVSANINETVKKEILDAIETINKKLPFLVALTPSERRELPKMGARTQSFVKKSIEVASQNDEILPRYFKVDELEKDLQLVDSLAPIALSLSQLSKKVDD
ncbi:MAG TPA: hypothetical protein DCE42_10385, partial [Myxococcales bacterium]|nr:hypothetical protein [Myxococcales bacterium]